MLRSYQVESGREREEKVRDEMVAEEEQDERSRLFASSASSLPSLSSASSLPIRHPSFALSRWTAGLSVRTIMLLIVLVVLVSTLALIALAPKPSSRAALIDTTALLASDADVDVDVDVDVDAGVGMDADVDVDVDANANVDADADASPLLFADTDLAGEAAQGEHSDADASNERKDSTKATTTTAAKATTTTAAKATHSSASPSQADLDAQCETRGCGPMPMSIVRCRDGSNARYRCTFDMALNRCKVTRPKCPE